MFGPLEENISSGQRGKLSHKLKGVKSGKGDHELTLCEPNAAHETCKLYCFYGKPAAQKINNDLHHNVIRFLALSIALRPTSLSACASPVNRGPLGCCVLPVVKMRGKYFTMALHPMSHALMHGQLHGCCFPKSHIGQQTTQNFSSQYPFLWLCPPRVSGYE